MTKGSRHIFIFHSALDPGFHSKPHQWRAWMVFKEQKERRKIQWLLCVGSVYINNHAKQLG